MRGQFFIAKPLKTTNSHYFSSIGLKEGTLAATADSVEIRSLAPEFMIENFMLILQQLKSEEPDTFYAFVDNISSWFRGVLNQPKTPDSSSPQAIEKQAQDFSDIVTAYYPAIGAILSKLDLTGMPFEDEPTLPPIFTAASVLRALERNREQLALMSPADIEHVASFLALYPAVTGKSYNWLLLLESMPSWSDLLTVNSSDVPLLDHDPEILARNPPHLRINEPAYLILLDTLNEQGRQNLHALTDEKLIAADILSPVVIQKLSSIPLNELRERLSALIAQGAQDLGTLPLDTEANDRIARSGLIRLFDSSWQIYFTVPFSSGLWNRLQ